MAWKLFFLVFLHTGNYQANTSPYLRITHFIYSSCLPIYKNEWWCSLTGMHIGQGFKGWNLICNSVHLLLYLNRIWILSMPVAKVRIPRESLLCLTLCHWAESVSLYSISKDVGSRQFIRVAPPTHALDRTEPSANTNTVEGVPFSFQCEGEDK